MAGQIHPDADLEALEASYRQALAASPDQPNVKRLLAVLLLSQGRYAEGFALFEARHDLPQYAKPALPYPEWRGEPVAGKQLLVWPEQGFGDQIMFARFAPMLTAMGAQVTLVCWPPLRRLFAESLGVEVIAAEGEISFPDPDYWVMAMSLAARLDLGVGEIPNAPYLRAAQAPLSPDHLRVGLMTRGNPVYANDPNRSLDAQAATMLAAPPAEMVDLSPEATGAKDFADTARVIAGLDLVISVDTAVAHLAGAMGKPCWVLLPAKGVDWRWLRGRRDSPWYRSVRLYRQAEPGDWRPIVDEIGCDLTNFTRP